MSSPIISVENLGKRYTIRHEANGQRGGYRRLSEELADAAKRPLRALARRFRSDLPACVGLRKSEDFWALRDVSFDVHEGEALGIIGRNGAGKSTLLKVFSRITEPSEGRVRMRGRVASLLEVGTGFHPELTGRENIYLNGAILGMSRAEIKRKFDEIVAFAEVETFLDTPVKRYSSGMYVRLAFAVAAHLDTEVLVVDEVLAVGDVRFQKRCLGKLEAMGTQGRTVIFVSHSMPMITRLCSRTLLLNDGRVVADGEPSRVTRDYASSDVGSPAERVWPTLEMAPGDRTARLRAVRVRDQHDAVAETIDIRQPMSVEIEYWNLQSRLRPTVSLHFINEDGITLFCSNDFMDREWWQTEREPGLVRAICNLPGNFFAEGRIFVLAAVCSYNPDIVHALVRDAVSWEIVDRSDGDGSRGSYGGHWPGVLRPMLKWSIAKVADMETDQSQ